MNDCESFLAALAKGLPEEERLILCGFAGDPATVGPSAWKPRPWRPGRDLPFGRLDNAYTTVSSFRRATDGTFRRRGETFAAGRALMIDDVGTKVDRKVVDGKKLPVPSAVVETSPGNFQYWYFLDIPETDAPRFDGIIRAFIAGKLLGADPGMSGITRVGRLPGYVNDKPKYERDGVKWICKLTSFSEKRYSIDSLLQAFKLKIIGRRSFNRRLPTAEAINRNGMFLSHYEFLKARGMLKRANPDVSGWIEITCPWVGDHTGGANTGAAIREPNAENDFYGAFRCHHGHCADRGWHELTDWISDLSQEELANVNASAVMPEQTKVSVKGKLNVVRSRKNKGEGRRIEAGAKRSKKARDRR